MLVSRSTHDCTSEILHSFIVSASELERSSTWHWQGHVMRAQPPKTPLQKSMDQLGKQLSIYSFVIIIIISLLGVVIQHREIIAVIALGVRCASPLVVSVISPHSSRISRLISTLSTQWLSVAASAWRPSPRACRSWSRSRSRSA